MPPEPAGRMPALRSARFQRAGSRSILAPRRCNWRQGRRQKPQARVPALRAFVPWCFAISWWRCIRRLHAAKSKVIASGAELAFAARSDHVTSAILVGAQKRTAAMDALFLGRLSGIERRVRPLRIACDAAGFGQLHVVIR